MWHDNVELIADHDLQGRSGFKLASQEVEGRFFLYVAGFLHSGWSILGRVRTGTARVPSLRRGPSQHDDPPDSGPDRICGGAYLVADRAYCPWKRARTVILDVSDRERPKHVSTLSGISPVGSTIAVHPAVPLVGRDVVVVNGEALQGRSAEPANYGATVEISHESDPMTMAVTSRNRAHRSPPASAASSTREVDSAHTISTSGKACMASHPTIGSCMSRTATPACRSATWATPVLHSLMPTTIPDDPKERLGPVPSELVHQAEDVIVDRRGVIYLWEANRGIYIFTHQYD
jgi:hypothetical protein